MQCPACTRQVAAWADFCPHCGAAQIVTAPHAQTEAQTDAYAGEPVSLTDEVFGWSGPETPVADDHAETPIESTPVESTPIQPSSIEATPIQPMPVVVPPAPVMPPTRPVHLSQEDADRSGEGGHGGDGEDEGRLARPGSARALLMVAGALVAATLIVILWSVLRVDAPDDQETAASPSGSASASAVAPPSGPATSSASASASPSVTPSPLPAGAISCGTSESAGSADTAAIFTPDPNTTCPFALAVATAYRSAAPEGGEASVTANSPVTGQDYALTCTGALPTVCRADSGATVYLTRP